MQTVKNTLSNARVHAKINTGQIACDNTSKATEKNIRNQFTR